MKLEMLNCTFSFSTNIVSVNHNASKQINVKFLGKSLSKSSLWCGEWLWSHDISCCLSPRRQPPVTSSDRGPGSVDLGTSPCNLSCISGHRAHSIYQETGDCDANKVMPIKKTLVPLSSQWARGCCRHSTRQWSVPCWVQTPWTRPMLN